MTKTGWWAKGLLLENCSCQLLCPAHISFKQTCEGERCLGHWAVHIAEGRYDGVDISQLNVVVVFEAPIRMFSGDWTEILYIDDRASPPQRRALEAIFSGVSGGPWETLGRFVATRLDTKFVPVELTDLGGEKRMRIPGLFETAVTALRGSDGKRRAVLDNLHNLIHGAVHVLGRGETRCTDPPFVFTNERKHGLYSDFSWRVPD